MPNFRNENLVRILDLISEIESRIEPLKNQAEKAKEFLKLRDELKGIEINLLVNTIDRLKVSLEKKGFWSYNKRKHHRRITEYTHI